MKTRIFFSILLSLLCPFTFAQKKHYLDENWNETTGPNSAKEYYIVQKNKIGKNKVYTQTSFFLSGQKKAEYSYKTGSKDKNFGDKQTVGKEWEWFEDGKVKLEANYNMQGKLDGKFLCFWTNGMKRRYDLYEKGKLIESNCYDSLGNKLPEYFPHKTDASFFGGEKALMKYLCKAVKYPMPAAIKKAQGRVMVKFIIEKDGTISHVQIEKSIDNSLDKEAFRVISSMPKWIPATYEGKKVRTKYFMPIDFRIM